LTEKYFKANADFIQFDIDQALLEQLGDLNNVLDESF